MWSTGEGNGKPLKYSCLENHMNSMKRQKDRTLNDEMVFSLAKHLQGDGQPLERMCSFCCSYSQVLGTIQTRLLDGISDSIDMSFNKLQEMVGLGSLACCNPWGRRVGYD